MSTESALSYAALILADAEVEITSEKLMTLTKAADVQIEGIWADIYARALESQDLKSLLVNFSAGASAGAAPSAGGAVGGAAAAGGAEAAEEKKEEAKEESDDDMGFGLFD